MNDSQRVARERMVARIREQKLAGEAVLAAMESLPRHRFVDPALAPRAYGRDALPIGEGQTLSHPEIVARMTEALRLETGHCVLEVGTGSGYQAALLALLHCRVWTIERIPVLLESARRVWEALRLAAAIRARLGDGYLGWPGAARFDRILLTAAPSEIPNALLDQLRDGGLMVLPLDEGDGQRLVRLRREGERAYREDLGDCSFVPMRARTREDH
jgi:protein-L-isoaspartate(D-aspartate) O-methyltransferase